MNNPRISDILRSHQTARGDHLFVESTALKSFFFAWNPFGLNPIQMIPNIQLSFEDSFELA